MFIKHRYHARSANSPTLLGGLLAVTTLFLLLAGSCDQVEDSGMTTPNGAGTGLTGVSGLTEVNEDGPASGRCRFQYDEYRNGRLVNVPDSVWKRPWSQHIRFGNTWSEVAWTIKSRGACPPGIDIHLDSRDELPNVWLKTSLWYGEEVPLGEAEVHWKHTPGSGIQWSGTGSGAATEGVESVAFNLILSAETEFKTIDYDTTTVTITLDHGCDCIIDDIGPNIGIICPDVATQSDMQSDVKWFCVVWSDDDHP